MSAFLTRDRIPIASTPYTVSERGALKKIVLIAAGANCDVTVQETNVSGPIVCKLKALANSMMEIDFGDDDLELDGYYITMNGAGSETIIYKLGGRAVF